MDKERSREKCWDMAEEAVKLGGPSISEDLRGYRQDYIDGKISEEDMLEYLNKKYKKIGNQDE